MMTKCPWSSKRDTFDRLPLSIISRFHCNFTSLCAHHSAWLKLIIVWSSPSNPLPAFIVKWTVYFFVADPTSQCGAALCNQIASARHFRFLFHVLAPLSFEITRSRFAHLIDRSTTIHRLFLWFAALQWSSQGITFSFNRLHSFALSFLPLSPVFTITSIVHYPHSFYYIMILCHLSIFRCGFSA